MNVGDIWEVEMTGLLMHERMSERENEDASEVSHLKNQVDGWSRCC